MPHEHQDLAGPDDGLVIDGSAVKLGHAQGVDVETVREPPSYLADRHPGDGDLFHVHARGDNRLAWLVRGCEGIARTGGAPGVFRSRGSNLLFHESSSFFDDRYSQL
jgi:hypothetical protein